MGFSVPVWLVLSHFFGAVDRTLTLGLGLFSPVELSVWMLPMFVRVCCMLFLCLFFNTGCQTPIAGLFQWPLKSSAPTLTDPEPQRSHEEQAAHQHIVASG